MTISWGGALYPKYLTIQRCEWDKGEYKRIEFARVPLGWAFNIGRLLVCYDNYKNVKGDRE